MTEELDIEPGVELPLHREAIANLAKQLPEIEEDRELIEKMSDSLVQTYGIKPEFFESESHTLFFISLAQRLGRLRYEADLPGQHRMSEEVFINNAMTLLLLENSAHYESTKHKIDKQNNYSDATHIAAINRYTNHQLTKELVDAVNNGLLSAVKDRLDLKQEQPYNLRVLSIGDGRTAGGMVERLRPPDDPVNLSSDEIEIRNAYQEFSGYINGLQKRKAAFFDEAGIQEDLFLWNVELEGENYLCLPQPMAEKLLHRDQTRDEAYDEKQWKTDLAFFEHEYVHTQNPLHLDRQPFFGIALEERRATHFSKDNHSYRDIDAFYADLYKISGIDVVDILDKSKNVPSSEVYKGFAESMGLQWLLEFALVMPNGYIKDERPLQKQIQSHLGGPDGFLTKMYDIIRGTEKEEELKQKIKATAANLKDPDTLATWVAIRRSYGMNLIADMIEEELEQQGVVTQQ